MNIPGLNGLLYGNAGGTQAGRQPAGAPERPRETPATSTPATSAPQDARQRPQDARPVLDLSDASLTRRDLPRGSLVDICC